MGGDHSTMDFDFYLNSLEVVMSFIRNLPTPSSGDASSSFVYWWWGWVIHHPLNPALVDSIGPSPCPLSGEAWSSPEARLSCLLVGVPKETRLYREGEVRANSPQSSQLPFIQLLPHAGPEYSTSVRHLTLTATPQGWVALLSPLYR